MGATAQQAAGTEQIAGWVHGRLPDGWFAEPAEVSVDRDEILIVGRIETPSGEGASPEEAKEAAVGRITRFREDTRDQRIRIAREAEHRFERKVSWGVAVGERRELWTHVAAPVMTRLRQPQRLVLDTLVDAGVARSRSDALAWCVRLVGQHEGDWLDELRAAMSTVADVRAKGPAA